MDRRYVSLFWRLLIPNVTVLAVACVVLILEPANGRIPSLAGGLTVMVGVNAILIRRATQPLARLTRLMRLVDPMHPGRRVPIPSPASELTVVAEAFNDMLDRLESERREAGSRAVTEREAERRRVAAELHDQIGQTLTAAVLHANRLADAAPDSKRAELLVLRDTVLTSVEDVRRLARELRPDALDTLGLVPALTNLGDRMQRSSGVEIRRALQRDLPPIADDAAVAIFRVAQEALTNAVRHGRPRLVELSLGRAGDRLQLSVTDDGVGMNVEGCSGSGIRGMRERALSIGAELRVDGREQGAGTRVILELPVRR